MHILIIQIRLRSISNFSDDLKIIRRETGIRLPKGYTWHHIEDGNSVLMVSSKIHSPGCGGFNHIGGAALLRKG